MVGISVVGVPMDFGAGRRGVDMGPSALRLARLEETLRDLGHDVVDLGNVEVPVAETVSSGTSPRYVDVIAATCTRTAELIGSLDGDRVPIVLGGDHSVSMGSVAGTVALAAPGRRTGVLWIDAHGDLNTPATSPSGNVHGMPLAHLLGEGDARLAAPWGGGRLLAPEDVVAIGVRSLDPGERALARRLGLRVFTMSDVDRRGIGAVADEALALLGAHDRLHVSFDADVLDPSVAPGVGTPVPGGLDYREAHLLMEMLSDGGRVVSVDLLEVNPILDEANRSAAVVVELAASLFGRRIL